jgi:hypothetical protein
MRVNKAVSRAFIIAIALGNIAGVITAQDATTSTGVGPKLTAAQKSLLFGRDIRITRINGSERVVGGELLAVSGDTAWINGRRGVVALLLSEAQSASLRRHSYTPGKAIRMGLISGAISGAGLALACSRTDTSGCGMAVPTMVATSLIVSGLMALTLLPSASMPVKPISAEMLRPYARFPQGMPVTFVRIP